MKDKLMKMATAVYDDAHCLLMIDKISRTYNVIKAVDYWQENVKEEGTLEDLFYLLFTKSVHDGKERNNDYRLFVDESFFDRNNYQGSVTVNYKGKEKEYGIFLLAFSDKEATLIIRSNEDKVKSDNIELEKLDTLQDSLLFSMIVDLNSDSCINPNTTEVSADRQDFMDLKYSDWRMMISNMFLESDRPMFFRRTAPEYVINTLEELPRYRFELQMLNMQGKYIWTRLEFTRMKEFSRENPRFLYTVKDVNEDMTRLLKQESIVKAVEEQNQKLQTADKAKTKFFSSMSHEIRTPINAIIGMNEVILRESQEEGIRSYARDIKGASRYLLSIVNDILDYSKIEAGKMEIVPVEYNPVDMIHRVSKLMKSRFVDKGLEFKIIVGENIPKRLFGDEIRISQVIINLLTNAAKYTVEGGATFSVDGVTDKDNRFCLKVCVKDTGIGIREEDMEKLFSDYVRLDTDKNRNIEGTGLGMSIVVALLKQMGSELQVESVYTEGSTFSFLLPQKVVDSTPNSNCVVNNEEDSEIDIDSVNLSSCKVLVVDDNGVNLRVAKALLAPYGMIVDLANSGKMCLEKAEKCDYDIVFMDHNMPQMDGVETLKQLRNKGGHYSKSIIVALTAMSGPGIRDEYMSMGFTDFLDKPIIAESLNLLLKRYYNELLG